MKKIKRVHECPPYPVLHCDGGDACWDDCERDGRYVTVVIDESCDDEPAPNAPVGPAHEVGDRA